MADVPAPPEEPHPDECCHRGCDPCILDYYETALARWEMRVSALGLDPREVLESLRRKPSPGV